MADLIHVRDKSGNESFVGQSWLDRWPDDFDVIPDSSGTHVPESPEPIQAQDTPISPVAKPVKEIKK